MADFLNIFSIVFSIFTPAGGRIFSIDSFKYPIEVTVDMSSLHNKCSTGNGNGFIQMFKREIGLCPPRNYSRRISASKTLIEHINLYGELNNGHESRTYTLAFNSTGQLLLSGSDTHELKLWDWEKKKLLYSYPSGHSCYLTQTQIVPFTNDRKIITAATDGEVRLLEVLNDGSSVSMHLSKYQGYITCYAVEPGSPHNVLCCTEDGNVIHYDLRIGFASNLFCYWSSKKHCSSKVMFSMAFDPNNPNYVAMGGEEAFVPVYDLRNCRVTSSMKEVPPVNIFCCRDYLPKNVISLAYSSSSELLVSYTNYTIYLFQKNMGYPSFYTSVPERDPCDEQIYSGHCYGNKSDLSEVGFLGSNNEYIVSGSDVGRIFIWEKESCALVRSIVADSDSVHQVLPHPCIPILATCGNDSNLKIWSPSSNKRVDLFDGLDEVRDW